jgi:hypothetical protein
MLEHQSGNEASFLANACLVKKAESQIGGVAAFLFEVGYCSINAVNN